MPLLLTTPHFLVEGAIIAAYAIRARHAVVYLRGEVVPVLRRLQAAVTEAYDAGYLGSNILGSGYDLDLIVHAGAGAYICGEETALLDSLEGRRGQPRLRPSVPRRRRPLRLPNGGQQRRVHRQRAADHGQRWTGSSRWAPRSPWVHAVLAVRTRHPSRPVRGPAGHNLARTAGLRRRVRAGHELKFWTPGGSSTPLLTAEHLDVPLDYEGMGSVGSMLGTKALQIFDETTCVVRAVRRWTQFYAHESCGKCTPCREGTYWLAQIYARAEDGRGTPEDLDKLLDISEAILGKSFCALATARPPIMSSLKYFRAEYEAHLGGGCPFDPYASMLAVPRGGSVSPARPCASRHKSHRHAEHPGNFGLLAAGRRPV